ncbi:hypothetical protein GCM10022199_08400 [Marihabitans asiaticum]|uniref:Uncharacterized protein n=1 Tax=Marihabitans asiaticum TaxID=415218 RepID=A0A560WH18_9MICO|nr:hypothetical protein [Marihabitans asiaticum]TWD16868.1 hypothetical protein FB557_0414 [Marihabitans asiaticum]
MIRALLALVAALLGLVAGAGGAIAEPADQPEVVLVGVAGLTWEDLEQAPTIRGLAERGATANLVVRGLHLQTCPADGWLSLGAGDRVAVPRDGSPDLTDPAAAPRCADLPSPVDGRIEGWDEIAAHNDEGKEDATLGLLARSLTAAGECVQSAGAGAGLAAAGGAGEVGSAQGCRVRLVDAGVIDEGGSARRQQVAAADAAVAGATAALPEDALVVVAGLADDGSGPRLHPVVYAGGGVEPGALRSASTRRAGVVQLPDLTVDLLERVGAEPAATSPGRALTVVGAGDAADRVEDQSAIAAQLAAANATIPVFFRTFGYSLLVVTVLGAVGWWLTRTAPVARAALRRVLTLVALTAASVPAGTYVATLTGWWRSGQPGVALAGVVGGFAVGLAAVAWVVARLARSHVDQHGEGGSHLDQRRGGGLAAVGVVGGVTALLLALDLLLRGGQAIFLSVLGLHPWDGGRFYGFGNVPFAVFVTGALLAVTAVLDPLLRSGSRRAATVLAAGLGGLVLLVDAAPFAGADGGGALALIPAVGFLVLAISGARVTLTRLALLAAATAVGFLTIAGLDYLRPEGSRSHLGRFFARLLDGDAWPVLERKLATNVDMLLGPERTALLVPVLLIVLIWALAVPGSTLARPIAGALEAHPALRPGLISLVVALTVGFLLNDSGTAIPAVSAIILLPALAVLALSGSEPSAGSPATGRRS